MPTTEICTYCGGKKTSCPECNRFVHVSELTAAGCTFCAPLLCPVCQTRALRVSGCYCGLSHGPEDVARLLAEQNIPVEIDLPPIETIAAALAMPVVAPVLAKHGL
jgi:hypothetical protein